VEATQQESVAEPWNHQSRQDRRLLCREERAVLDQGPASEHFDPTHCTTVVDKATKQW